MGYMRNKECSEEVNDTCHALVRMRPLIFLKSIFDLWD